MLIYWIEFNNVISDPEFQILGFEYKTQNDCVFVPGFFCQLLVELFKFYNVSTIFFWNAKTVFYISKIGNQDLVEVHSNGAVFTCPSLFCGQVIVTLGAGAKSISIVMIATNPDVHYLTFTFQQLVLQYPQCIQYIYVSEYIIVLYLLDNMCEKIQLCSSCIEEWLLKKTRNITQVGYIKQGAILSN